MKQSTVTADQYTIGLDLGDSRSTLCVLDARGQIVEEANVLTRGEALRDRFHRPRARVVMEACGQSSWIGDLLEELGHEVCVINPRQLKLISHSVKKTDRNDARLLARIGRTDVGLLQPTHRRRVEYRNARTVLKTRRSLVEARTRLVNSVRSTAKGYGCKIRTCSTECFAKAATASLPAELRKMTQPQLDALSFLTKQIESCDLEIERLGREQFPQTELLRRIHGVGPQVALAFVAAIDEPDRFRRSREVGPYLGLTPRRDQSGDSDPRLRISKHGDGSVRSLLVSSATHILRVRAPDSDLKRFGQRTAGGHPSPRDRGRARIAVARKLAVLMHHLLQSGEVYEPLRNAANQG
jgi:transposase